VFNTDGAAMGSGIFLDRVADTTTFAHCLLWGPVGGVGIRVARGSEVRIFGGRILGSADPYKGLTPGNIGVHLTGDNGGVHIVTTDLIGLHTGLLIGSPGGKSNREVFITHATFDSSTHGIRQTDGAYTSIAGCWAASSDEDQILLEETARGAIMTISGGTIFNGGAYGRPGAKNGFVAHAGSFLMTGVTVRNNQGTGILVEPAARDYAITGCRIADNGTGAKLAGDSFTFTGNVLARNAANLLYLGGPNKVVQANVITPDDTPPK
jgi:nitrous oxidase accessory protein NosD